MLSLATFAATCAAQDAGSAQTGDGKSAPESWNAKFQTTYVWQKHPSFRAGYTGPNSLLPTREKGYTWTATAAFGVRPWSGGEFYFNPEMSQAAAMSELHGLGGMSNGENQKGSSSTPDFYAARAFLRQTWGLGGGREKLESDANQLAGSVDRNRLVLTLGKLSVIDVFDNNAYAHDPRTQFLNWSFLTYGAFDYAGDVRGYSIGAALEYYRGDWALRIGRFAQPKESNGAPLDYRLARHYGDQVEIEHAHEIFGRPGKLRLLGFRNYANMGSFNDALADAAASGKAPDVANVRRDRSKHGFGVSLEQSVSDNAGVFARLSWNDGQTEAYAFTEIERSATVGAVIKGNGWGRPQDAFGIAFARNGLSAAHQAYLARGGLGAFLGDGALNYGAENIVEAYYSIALHKRAWISADYQRIAHPGYNVDRGPVSFYAARLHLEF